MRTKKLIILFCLIALAAPIFVYAAPSYWPIVPCGINRPTAEEIQAGAKLLADSYYQSCNQCTLIQLFKNLIDLVVQGLVPILGTFFFLVGGFMILLGNAKPDLIQKGKSIMWDTAIGIAIILSSYLITNFILKSLAGNSDITTKWNTITCRVSTLKEITDVTFPTVGGGQPGPAPAPAPGPAVCNNITQLAVQYGVPSTAQNSQALNTLVSCVTSRIGNLIDQNQIYTFEKTNNLCNFTRGNPVCGVCAHKVNSCHYGGASGSSGSEAVDFNAKNPNLEAQLYQELLNLKSTCSLGYILFEADHTHISTNSCSGN